MYDLKGRTALVTGAAQGLGLGIAIECARAGSRVIVADLNLERASTAAEEIKAMGHEALALALDITDATSVCNCVQTSLLRFSQIDFLVNNAGVFQRRLGLESDEDEFKRCVDVNLTGIWRMVRALVPHFRKRGGGRIINISSTGGRLGVDFAPAYCASKAGVINLTQSLAAALGADNITVNTVCPGAVATAMQDEIKALRSEPAASNTASRSRQVLVGPLTAQDIGHAVVFFASDYARNITGQALNVDCGFLMN